MENPGGLPASSEMVFTFAQKRPVEAIHATAVRAAEVGEPWRTYIRPEELGWKLAKMGFSSLAVLPPEEACEFYYTGREDGLPPPQGAGIASVIV